MRENTWYVSVDTVLLRMVVSLEYVIDVVRKRRGELMLWLSTFLKLPDPNRIPTAHTIIIDKRFFHFPYV